VKILSVAVADEIARPVGPGTVLDVPANAPPIVAALPGASALVRVQPENGRPQDGAEFARGRRLKPGDRFAPEPLGPGTHPL
jgi:methionyl-tRNA formyltransferase